MTQFSEYRENNGGDNGVANSETGLYIDCRDLFKI